MTEQECVFCKIVKGEIQSLKVYEDDKCIAILDINPASKGHLLLIPKEHHAFFPQIPEELAAHLGQVAKWLGNSSRKLFNALGVSIFIATGPVAGQNSPHTIIHIIPRQEGDGISLQPPLQKRSKEELDKISEGLIPKINVAFGIKEEKPKTPVEEKPAKKGAVEKKPDLDAISGILGGSS